MRKVLLSPRGGRFFLLLTQDAPRPCMLTSRKQAFLHVIKLSAPYKSAPATEDCSFISDLTRLFWFENRWERGDISYSLE